MEKYREETNLSSKKQSAVVPEGQSSCEVWLGTHLSLDPGCL